MPLKLLAATLTFALLLSGCHADAGTHGEGASVGGSKIDRPQSEMPFSAPATPDPAQAVRPDSNKEEVIDMSLG
jgi:hypothetical protein